mgnify:FL=1
MKKKISEKDKKDWENFLSSDVSLPNKDLNIDIKKKVLTKKIDLHGFSLEEANKKIEEIIKVYFDIGVKKIIVITGKGLHSNHIEDPHISKDLGILKNSVPEFIKNNKELMSLIQNIEIAKVDDGGEGAFYIFLKKKL